VAVTDWIQTAAAIYFAWRQNQIFERQNEIFARQAGQTAMPPKASQMHRIRRYWPTMIMVGLMVLTGYDIYARHGEPSVVPWWFYVLLLVIVAAIGFFIRADIRKGEAEKYSSTAEQRHNIKLAGVLEGKAGDADWLAKELERVWHLYHEADDVLIRPLGKNTLPDAIQRECDKQLFSFRKQYYEHIGSVKYHAPSFHSAIMDGPRPYWDIQYLDLREELKNHATMLRQLAKEREQS
jgi:hypothetical protein